MISIMKNKDDAPILKRIRHIFIGKPRSPLEPGIFHTVSLTAFLAWVGLGSDGISSSCYGPEEAFISLGAHPHLAIILAFMIVGTVFIISASYSQIIELFPTGGGGYLVASKLLTPSLGVVAGCALIVDYVLTITISVASGADAVFSFLPAEWHQYKLTSAFVVLFLLTLLNMRGVRESVTPLIPIFIVFILTHVFAILFVFATHIPRVPELFHQAHTEFSASTHELGLIGVILLILHAYSMGGGTYTGIEAVSNAMPILREPKVKTGRRAMFYMALSLAFIAGGLTFSYLLYDLRPETGKTLNALLFQRIVQTTGGHWFMITALLSEAFILLVAAQTGFLDGPRVLSYMALDNWMPKRFAILSDRLVTQNGILLMSLFSFALMWFSHGSVRFLVVLYSINVFLTFTLSQSGMVRHWWKVRHKDDRWVHGLLINGFGLMITAFILIMVIIVKFHEGAWVTLVATTGFVIVAFLVHRHYEMTLKQLKRLDDLVDVALPAIHTFSDTPPPLPDPNAPTAVVMVNGFSGFGLHALFNILRLFQNHFKNFIFIEVGIIDAGRFKGIEEIENLRNKVIDDLEKYVKFMQSHKYYAEGVYSLGIDVVAEIEKLALQVQQKFPNSVFFTSQLVFGKETFWTRLLHNFAAFTIQKRLYHREIPVVILPIRVT